ncbi:MAG TPA: hypothetical protein VF941_13040 [Clostridia bacterium]
MNNISTKELNYINDILSWELLASKKSNQYGHQEANSIHSGVFFDASRAHQQNYNNLLAYLERNNKMKGGTH